MRLTVRRRPTLGKEWVVKISHVLCIAILGSIAVPRAQAIPGLPLFAATAGSGAGELYQLSSVNGAVVKDIGPLNDAGALNYGMTGLAFDPVTQQLYGSTAHGGGSDASTHDKLVTINPATGLVTPIGPFNVPTGGTMTDISFDPTTDTLYGIGSVGGAHLYSINTVTGQATKVGDSGFGFTTGGGIAIDSTGIVYGSPDVAHFGTYNKSTGAYVQIADPGPDLSTTGGYGGMCFDGATLYSSFSSPNHLLTIDTGSGAVTDLGASISRLDAIAFPTPEPTSLAAFALAMTAFAARPRRKS